MATVLKEAFTSGMAQVKIGEEEADALNLAVADTLAKLGCREPINLSSGNFQGFASVSASRIFERHFRGKQCKVP